MAEASLSQQDRRLLLLQAQEALRMQELWMERGFAFVRGQDVGLPSDFAGREELCPVDHWLRERLDERLKSLPLYEITCKMHIEFHDALDTLFEAAPPTLEAQTNFQRVGGRGSIASA